MASALRIRDDAAVGAEEIVASEVSRREVLRGGAALTGALAASSVPLLVGAREAMARAESDAEVVRAAISLEEVAVHAYTDVLGQRTLAPPARRLIEAIRRHERAHAAALGAELERLGGAPVAPAPGAGATDRIVRALAGARTRGELARFAVELELVSVAAYRDAVRRIRDSRLLGLCAQITGCEGQHLVVLRTLAAEPAVPEAFEVGKAVI